MTLPADPEEPEAGYSLIMPFVLCESEGGPYPDTAFAAGFECGQMYEQLATKKRTFGRIVRSANIKQLDLIAMRFGFVMQSEIDEDSPEWAHVVFEYRR